MGSVSSFAPLLRQLQKSMQPLSAIHHTALKTRNIERAVCFYELLGFSVACKFRAGPARAAWLSKGNTSRLELLEVPPYMLRETEHTVQRAPDLMALPSVLGYNHVALDVTEVVHQLPVTEDQPAALSDWIGKVNQESVQRFGKTLRVALEPQQKIIGQDVYEVAFLYDADGCLIELLHLLKRLPQEMQSGWAPLSNETLALQQ